jgi:hypothetical protein
MSISTSTWVTIISDASTVVQDISSALTVGAAFGVPDAALIEPFVVILEGALAKAKAAAAGNLTLLAAEVSAADTAAAAAEAVKFPAGT